VGEAKARPTATLRAAYEAGFMAALAPAATRGRHTNVLQHAAGHLRDVVDAGSRAELAEAITGYRAGQVPRIVALTLLRHHARVHDVAYLRGQVYLEPSPEELRLRGPG
jgi:uncharacterized protein YbgA (DUF1722 family)